MAVIDAHQHFWNPDRVSYDWLGPDLGPINRAIEFPELEPLLAATGVERTVLVQSADNAADTDYMFEVAASHPEIAAVVGWVPLDDPAAVAERLPALRANPAFVGIRNLIHTRPDHDWLLRPEVLESLGILAAHDVPFDVVSVLPRHLQHVPTLSDRHPDLRMVIDHLSKPPIKAGGDEPWRSLIARAAENPRVYAKVSGLYPAMGDLAAGTADDVRPYLELALELFFAADAATDLQNLAGKAVTERDRRIELREHFFDRRLQAVALDIAHDATHQIGARHRLSSERGLGEIDQLPFGA